MKCTIKYERLNPTTAQGHMIKVTHLFSSNDQKEIDELEKELEESIGAGLIMDGGENDGVGSS